MSKVYVNEELLWVIQAKSTLEANGIDCFLRNEFASSIAGKVPFNETWPELWVHDNSDVEQASLILKRWQKELSKTEPEAHYVSWKCEKCSETNEGNFSLCWSCGMTLNET